MKKEYYVDFNKLSIYANKEKDVLFKISLDPGEFELFQKFRKNNLIQVNFCGLRERVYDDKKLDKYRNTYQMSWQDFIKNIENNGSLYIRCSSELKKLSVRQEQSQTMERKIKYDSKVETLRTEKKDRHLILLTAKNEAVKPFEGERFFFELVSMSDTETFRFRLFPIDDNLTLSLNQYNTFDPIISQSRSPNRTHAQSIHEMGEEKLEQNRQEFAKEDIINAQQKTKKDIINAHQKIADEHSDDEDYFSKVPRIER